MLSNVPALQTLDEMNLGDFFILIDIGQTDYALCFKASYSQPEIEKEEATRIVPLYWPGHESSVGVPVYQSAFRGRCVKPDDARIEVDLTSISAAPEHSAASLYSTKEGLFFPLQYQGRSEGYANVETGAISQTLSSQCVRYGKWSITIPNGGSTRRTIFESPLQPIPA